VKKQNKILGIVVLASVIVLSATLYQSVFAQEHIVPSWIKVTVGFWVDGDVDDPTFLEAIKFLIENKIIIIESEDEKAVESGTASVIIPNGNYDIANSAFYIPLNLEVTTGTTVVWVNDDTVPHTVQSQDEEGKIIGIFNSAPLNTGDRFAHTFDDEGVYNYYCTLHPWRVGVITVT
jgi:plastocyanin